MIEAIAAMLAGNGKAAAEAVPLANASACLAPIKATTCGIIWPIAAIVCPANSKNFPAVPPIAEPN